jgi:hypothetical protein
MELIWKSLRGIFINDFSLPITTVEDPYFDRQIHLLEDSFGAATKYLELMTTIRDYFNGNPQAFLEHRRSVKDKILNEILGSEAYKAMLADKSPLEDYKPLVGSRELYTEEQDGGMFISFDMVKANFQALRYVDPSIVRDCETWEEYVSKFTDIPYIAAAKQVRQEVLGKLNGKRLAAIEKRTANEFAKEFQYRLSIYGFSLFSIKTDEIIFKFEGTEKEFEAFHCGDQEFKGFKFKASKFKLHMRVFKRAFSDKRIVVYEKEDYLNAHRRILKAVPAIYYPQVYKLLNGMKIDVQSDLIFNHNHELCKFMYPIEPLK